MNRFTFYCALSMLLVASACGPTLKVTSDYDKTASFSSYNTFALYDPAGSKSPISQLNRERLENAVRSQMTAKGYTASTDTSAADLLVNIVTVAKEGQSVSANTDYYGYGGFYRPYYWGGGMGMASSNTTFNVDKYIDGSVIIDVVDRKTRRLLWEGTGNSEIDGPLKDPDTKIPQAVAKIMASYPSR